MCITTTWQIYNDIHDNTNCVHYKVEPTEQNIEYLVNGVRATPNDDDDDDAGDADLSESEGNDDSE